MKKTVLTGALLVSLLGASAEAGTTAPITKFSPPAAVADAFFTQIEVGDLGSAYQLLSPNARRRQPMFEFQRTLGSLSGNSARYAHSLYYSGYSSDPSTPPPNSLACFRAVPRGGYGNMIYLAAVLVRPDPGGAFAVERYQVASEPYRECPGR